jgi:hypothetical protein
MTDILHYNTHLSLNYIIYLYYIQVFVPKIYIVIHFGIN